MRELAWWLTYKSRFGGVSSPKYENRYDEAAEKKKTEEALVSSSEMK